MERVFPRRSSPPPALPAVTPREAHDAVARENALIVDVREPDEWAEVRIPGARHIPLGTIAERASEIPRDRLVFLQCRSGARSARATQALREAGYTNVRNLEGGISEWAAYGLPLEHGA